MRLWPRTVQDCPDPLIQKNFRHAFVYAAELLGCLSTSSQPRKTTGFSGEFRSLHTNLRGNPSPPAGGMGRDARPVVGESNELTTVCVGGRSSPVADLDLPVAEGGLRAEEETPGSGLSHAPDDFMGKDIKYPNDTKSSCIRGKRDLKPTDKLDSIIVSSIQRLWESSI